MLMNFLRLFVFVIIILVSYQAMAKGPQGVMYTKHNLANWNTAADTFKSSNVNEVCVFCHTPHAAGGTPLWNREISTRKDSSGTAQPIYFYAYSSPYMHHSLPKQLGEETLLCMSCHDGVSSMNVLHNAPNTVSSVNMAGGDQIADGVNWDLLNSSTRVTGFADIGDAYFVNGGSVDSYAGVGGAGDYYAGPGYMMFGVDYVTGKAVADHPISINYDEAYTSPGGNTRLKDKSATGLTFYGSSKNKLECTTCHDPHVNYVNTAKGGDVRYKPFLVRSNASSALCFSCHIK